jgi:hypothetical protein
MALDLWNKLRTPPKEALSEIQAGRLKGKSDINPTWRYQALTDIFGPCGFGWKFAITRQWTEQGQDGQLMCFVNVDLFVKDGDKWSDPIPGTGGDFLVKKERDGLYHNDEAYAMALTDALGKAMKPLGMAADVYWSRAPETKYSRESGPVPPAQATKSEAEPVCEKCGKAIPKARATISQRNNDGKILCTTCGK